MEKRPLRFLIAIFGLAVIGLFFSETVFASAITNNLKTTINEVITIVADDNLKNKAVLRRDKLRQVIGKGFNYRQMAMRSLAKEWKKRTQKEQTEFVELFKRFLEFSFANKIETFSGEKINYMGEKVIKGKYALVNTEIARKDGPVQVDYKLINENGNWLVYDFVVKGVSMIRNSRSQFEKIIREDSYEVLVENLSEKVKSIESKSSVSASETL
jgi:phospholipid transport system substrate-binding protein